MQSPQHRLSFDDPDATADELKAANKAMTKAAQELWEIVSKAELSALIEAANGYLDGSYTTESLEALQAAIDAAQAVAANDDATVAEVTEDHHEPERSDRQPGEDHAGYKRARA